MIKDKKIDLTEESVFGIQEFLSKNTVQIPWELENFDRITNSKTGELLSDEPRTWISMTYSIAGTTTWPRYYVNISDDADIWTTSDSDFDGTSYAIQSPSVTTTPFSGTSSSMSFQYSTQTSVTKYYMNYNLAKTRIETKKDAFGFEIDDSDEARLPARGKDSIRVCYECGRLIADDLWRQASSCSRHHQCEACRRKSSKNSFNRDAIWNTLDLRLNKRRFRCQEYEDPIPWDTEEEIRDAEKSKRHDEEYLSGHSKWLHLIPWLNDQKSYFGIGGKVDWPSIEDAWEIRLIDLGLVDSESEEKEQVGANTFDDRAGLFSTQRPVHYQRLTAYVNSTNLYV